MFDIAKSMVLVLQFALGWWAFVDGLSFTAVHDNRKVAIGFEDWAPGIVTTLGMIMQV